MDTPASPLVLTKICLPAARPRIISRGRLIDLLTPESGKNFILVSAPAGYGKTTCLAEWAHSLLRDGTAVAWYALDPSDDDPIPFAAYLVASLAQALGPTSDLAHIAQLLRASPEINLQTVLQSAINAVFLSRQDCVLILDDYHLISSPAIHSSISFLIEHLPENMRVVIGSRSDPPLPLARLRARGRLLEIRASHLRFTEDETGAFLNEVMKLDLSPEGINVLEARTEGWVAGLQLAALSITGRPNKENFIASFTGSHRFLTEYLLEEVVNRLPEGVQSFLLATSILDRMAAPLCDALLGDSPGSGVILEKLDQASLFVVALDDQGYWYRYHHLFRDFLQARLNKTQPGRIPSLHRAASEWLAGHHFLREAAQHAFLTQDWDFAAAFVEKHSFTMIIHSEISTIYEWCSAFPEEVMQKHPLLCIHQCWAWVFSFRRQNRSRVEQRLQQAEQTIAVMGDRRAARELTENIVVVRTFLSMAPDPAADPRGQLVLSQSMIGDYPEGNPGQFSALLTMGYAYLALHDAQNGASVLETARQIALGGGLFFGVVESTFHLARLATSQGQLRHAAELCRQGQVDIASLLAHPELELPALGCMDVALGCVLLEQDHLQDAKEHLLKGLAFMGAGMNPYYLMTAYVALARLYEIQDRLKEALFYITRLEETWPDITFLTRGLRVNSALRVMPEDPGALAEAAAWCEDFSSSLGEKAPPPGMGPFGAAEVYYLASLAWARAQITIGKPQAVLAYLERQLDLARLNGLANRVIELSLLEAQAWRAQGDSKRAWAALESALSAGQQEGYLRIFDQGAGLNRLLLEAAQHGIYPDYIERILKVTGRPEARTLGMDYHSPGPSARAFQASRLESGEHLSERELNVLNLMARGASNLEIAEQLVITVGTVKSHINHILGKLGARNRTEAVAQARGLGLLEI